MIEQTSGDLHAALTAVGVGAQRIAALWWPSLWICTLVFCAVIAGLVLALTRRGRAQDGSTAAADDGDRRARLPIAAAVAVSVGLLVVLMALSVGADRALAKIDAAGAVEIEVIGHQWWWELRYRDPDPSRSFVTANELHLPAGRPVLLKLSAADVIHSFWLPTLAGKRDLIPGSPATLVLRVDTPGRHRGQCAEFCGLQHAHMGLLAIVETPAAWAAWAERQRRPAAPPGDARAARGLALVEQGSCAMCHNIEGTRANGVHGPDLSHLASRERLAAGTLANEAANLAAWITNPHRYKPGVTMPALTYPAADLDAIVAYLSELE
ncbi:MAG TPA: c-type cytochrome [Gammaproteobacteria bacterium]|nr:c-type cytochrome [Gammaproteobacteria bacterium]